MKRLLILCALLAPTLPLQADDTTNPFAAVEVAPDIYALGNHNEGFAVLQPSDFVGGGAGLFVGEDYVVLIDDVMEDTAPALLAKVQELAGRPADFVINTHHHSDHVGGNALAAKKGAVVLSHDRLRERLAMSDQLETASGSLPVLTFSDDITIHVNGEEIHIFHIPAAHTDGDAVVHFRNANVIATGDIVFHDMFPFIDLDSGGTVDGFEGAIQTLIDLGNENTRYISGHGAVADRDGLAADRQMIVDAKAAVQALLDKGLQEEQIIAENPLAPWHDQYSWFFITTEVFTKTLIRSLTDG